MTQEQAEFERSLESALCWVQRVQERLRANDNTQGPREDLEARVQETEAICESEHEGRVKVDQALAAAEALLRSSSSEASTAQTQAKLKELKALWEETSIYITHCHSRVEWVWLHWGEYLRACEEFWAWLARLRSALELQLELQLGSREKQWQLQHHRVLLSDAQRHAQHLERLREEAEALCVRTQDQSVGPEALEALRDAYDQVLDRAKERVHLLEEIVEEQQTYDGSVQNFRAWLTDQTQALNQTVDMVDSPESKINTLQELYEKVSNKEEALRQVELVAERVRVGSSPGGAEQVLRDTEALRRAWEGLRDHVLLAQESPRAAQLAQEALAALSGQLRKEVSQLRTQAHHLSSQLEEEEEEVVGGRSDEHVMAMWRKSTDVFSAMATQEPCVEQLKVHLRELFRHSADGDVTSLSGKVLAAIKEFQGVKCRAFRLSAEMEACLRHRLHALLQEHGQWSLAASRTLGASEEVPELSHVTLLEQNMEELLQHSQRLQERASTLQLRDERLQERASTLQLRDELLGHALQPGNTQSLLKELSAAIRTREELHQSLLQRGKHMQGLSSSMKHFEAMCESTLKRLSLLRENCISLETLQPDIQTKRNQNNQLMMNLKELEEFKTLLTSLEALVPGTPAHRQAFSLLCTEWKALLNSVKAKVSDSRRSVAEHEELQESLQGLEKCILGMRERLDAFRGVTGAWTPEDFHSDVIERALGELLESELQFHRAEAQGQRVMAQTSEQGRERILQDLQRVREAWGPLHALSLQLHRLMMEHKVSGDVVLTGRTESQKEKGSDVPQMEQDDGAIRGTRSELGSGRRPGSKGCDQALRVGGKGVASVRKRNCVVEDVQFGAARTGSEHNVSAGGGVTASGDSADGDVKPAAEDEWELGYGGMDSLPAQGLGTVGERAAGGVEAGPGLGAGSRSEGLGLGVRAAKDFSRTVVDGGLHVWAEGEGWGKGWAEGEGWGGFGSDRELTSHRGQQPGWGSGAGLTQGQRSTLLCKDGQPSRTEAVDFKVGYGQNNIRDIPKGSHIIGLNQLQSKVDGLDIKGIHGVHQKQKAAGGELKQGDQRSRGEMMDRRDHPAKRTLGPEGSAEGSTPHTTAGSEERRHGGDPCESAQAFEAWLQAEDRALTSTLSYRPLSPKEMEVRQQDLQELRSHLAQGQSLFQGLLAPTAAGGVEDQALEELRYRWMLYKSKLRDSGDLETHLGHEDNSVPVEKALRTRKQKCSGFLYRVCCVALPLQLVLLSLLLLAVLLPLTDEGPSCSLANNFAHSFRLTLRHDGLPPT